MLHAVRLQHSEQVVVVVHTGIWAAGGACA
jgi:hypothetical protein